VLSNFAYIFDGIYEDVGTLFKLFTFIDVLDWTIVALLLIKYCVGCAKITVGFLCIEESCPKLCTCACGWFSLCAFKAIYGLVPLLNFTTGLDWYLSLDILSRWLFRLGLG
jgi:hypothetical protein